MPFDLEQSGTQSTRPASAAHILALLLARFGVMLLAEGGAFKNAYHKAPFLQGRATVMFVTPLSHKSTSRGFSYSAEF